MTDLFILRKHLAFRKGHYLLGQKQTESFIIWPFYLPSPELPRLSTFQQGWGASLRLTGKEQKRPALNHWSRNLPSIYTMSCPRFFTKAWKAVACNAEVTGKESIWKMPLVTVGKKKVMCPHMGKETTSWVSSFSSAYWFSFYWYTRKPPPPSTVWSYPQPQLIGPSRHLSQAGAIGSLLQDYWFWEQREHESVPWGGINYEMCTSQEL